MSTSNRRSSRTSDPAHHTDGSVAESYSFMEAILSHPILLKTLKAQEILRLKCVCKAWRIWYSYSEGINTRAISKARQEDDTRDWFFPVLLNKTSTSPPPESNRKNSWSWFGIWHEGAHDRESELEIVHSFLPPLLHLPSEWTFSTDRRSNDIIAGAGGLLLIKKLPGLVPVRRSSRLNPQAAGTSNSSHHLLHRAPSKWEPLLVVNPLTKEFRELPVPDCFQEGKVRFEGVQAHMLVDELSATYRIILTFRTFVCVYTSSCNSWRISRFTERGPWGRHHTFDPLWPAHVCASLYRRASRLLLFADIELRLITNLRPIHISLRLRVFEVDFEAGEWKLRDVHDIPHRSWCGNFEHWLLRDITYGLKGFDTEGRIRILPDLKLVECSGQIFVVVPARLDLCLELRAAIIQPARPQYCELVRHHNFDPWLEYMPLQFYIFQLQGPLLVHGVLRIQLPRSRSDLRYRWEALSRVPLQDHPPNRHWMSCQASGNVIWVSCEDYLLQYDLATRQSKTQIIPVNENDQILKFSYRPSFHMKP